MWTTHLEVTAPSLVSPWLKGANAGTDSLGKMGQEMGTGWAQEVAAPRYPEHGPGGVWLCRLTSL